MTSRGICNEDAVSVDEICMLQTYELVSGTRSLDVVLMSQPLTPVFGGLVDHMALGPGERHDTCQEFLPVTGPISTTVLAASSAPAARIRSITSAVAPSCPPEALDVRLH